MRNVGATVTKQTVDTTFGGLATRFRRIMSQGQQANVWLDAMTDGDLTALGYSSDDISDLKAAADEFQKLHDLYIGADTLAEVHDFRVAIRKLAGLDD